MKLATRLNQIEREDWRHSWHDTDTHTVELKEMDYERAKQIKKDLGKLIKKCQAARRLERQRRLHPCHPTNTL